jgi:hypothetical protein
VDNVSEGRNGCHDEEVEKTADRAALLESPGTLADAGRVASALVDELDAIRRHWRSGTAAPAGTLQRRDAELGLYLDVLRALCDPLPPADQRETDRATAFREAE